MDSGSRCYVILHHDVTGDVDENDERNVVYVHRSFGRYELYIHGHVYRIWKNWRVSVGIECDNRGSCNKPSGAQYNGNDGRPRMDGGCRRDVVLDHNVTSDDDSDDDQPFVVHVHRSYGRHGLHSDNHVNRRNRTRWVNVASDGIQE
jgi:TfoX/Sxy family transcriptional regulator of competence genes